MQLGWPATSLENWVLRNRVGFDSSVFRQKGKYEIFNRVNFIRISFNRYRGSFGLCNVYKST